MKETRFIGFNGNIFHNHSEHLISFNIDIVFVLNVVCRPLLYCISQFIWQLNFHRLLPHSRNIKSSVVDSSAALKSLFDVTAFINDTQVFICNKSNFIINPQSIYKYVHPSSIKLRATPSRGISIYI